MTLPDISLMGINPAIFEWVAEIAGRRLYRLEARR